jgi:ubiquinone/menaquinone biosynthesis C-methylase UbiE
MGIDYTQITEMPGNMISQEQLDMICCRYQTASKFVRGKDVLEVACGPGLGLGYLLAKGANKVVGGDINEDSLKVAREHYGERVELLSLDAQDLPFPDNSFDVVLIFEAIFYLPGPEKFLEECRRVLRKGGVLVLCLPNKDAPVFRPSPLSTRYFDAKELYSFLSNYGFKPEVHGAFPIERSIISQKIVSTIRFMGARALSVTTVGRRLKESLKRPVFQRKLILKNEIDGEMSIEVPLVPIPSGTTDPRYRILYAIAEAC